MKAKNLNELFERAEIFFQGIGAKDRLAVVHDSDPDGVCSAAILIRSMKKFGIKPSKIVASSPELAKKKGILAKGCNKIVILDLAPHLYERDLKKAKNSKIDVLIFDHHLAANIGAKNIFYVNPRLFDETLYMPTSYLVLKYYERCMDVKSMEWVATIGTVADYGLKSETQDLLRKYLNDSDYKNVWKSEFGKAAITLNAATAIVGAEKSLKIFLKLKSFDEFRKISAFVNAAERFETELAKKEKEVRKKIEFYPENALMISYVQTKFKHVASAISSKISREKPDWTFILFEKKNGEYKLHGRSQNGRVSIGHLFTKLGVGGGHVQAGGGAIKLGKLWEFQKKLMKEIKTYRPKEKAK